VRPRPLPMGSPDAQTERNPFHMHEVHMDLARMPATISTEGGGGIESTRSIRPVPRPTSPLAKTKREQHLFTG
jgi:hypothetical protein